MPKETMTALTLSGPAERVDEAIERFLVGRDIHPEDAVRFLAGIRKLDRLDGSDPYAEPLAQAKKLLEQLGVAPDYAPFEDRGYTTEDCASWLNGLAEQLQALDAARAAAEELLARDKALEDVYRHFASVPERLDALAGLRYIHCRYGRIHPENWEAFREEVDDAPGILLLETDHDGEWLWLLMLSVRDESDRMDAMLAHYGFERIRPDSVPITAATAAEDVDALDREEDENERRLAELAVQRAALSESIGGELLSRYAFLRYKSGCFAARGLCGQARGRFYIAGWMDAAEADAFAEEFGRESGFTCLRLGTDELPDAAPPVKMKKRRFAGVFSPILSMYGMPADGESDPRLFLALTYTLFFGIMFGDVGQGLVLVLAGWLLWKKTGGGIWRIFSVCGVSSVFFGLIYGSVFGNEELLPWGGFHVLEGGNLMTTLLLAVALGAAVLVGCMFMNIANALRRKDYRSALFSPNGVCGMIFYVSILALVVSLYSGLFAFPGLCVWPCIVLPLLLIWLGEPLGELVAGKKDWWPKKPGMVLVESFFDIFEAMLSYLSNTMSFLRVGAFAISHAGMMMVVYLIGETCSAAGNVAVLIFGNIFVAVLEAGLASIQIIRLQFYEMFGRYYTGRGRSFRSLAIEYK